MREVKQEKSSLGRSQRRAPSSTADRGQTQHLGSIGASTSQESGESVGGEGEVAGLMKGKDRRGWHAQVAARAAVPTMWLAPGGGGQDPQDTDRGTAVLYGQMCVLAQLCN